MWCIVGIPCPLGGVTLDSVHIPAAEQKEQWNASLQVSDSHLHPSIDFKWLKNGWSLQVEELKKQSTANSSLLPGISSVTMEASMIMSNIQRIIQVGMASLESLPSGAGAHSVIPNESKCPVTHGFWFCLARMRGRLTMISIPVSPSKKLFSAFWGLGIFWVRVVSI